MVESASMERLVIAAVLSPAMAWADPPGGLDGATVLSRVQAFYEKTTDYRASFRQVVTTRSPRRTFTRRGTVFFKKPGMMRWDYQVPDEVHYVSDGEVLWSYEVEEGVAWRLPIRQSELFEALAFLTGAGDLTRDLDADVGKPLPSGLVPVRLKPKGDGRMFRSVTLFVDPATGETRETEVEDPAGNVSHLWFDAPSYGPLPASGFRFRPPEGVRVEDLGSRTGTSETEVLNRLLESRTSHDP